MSPVQAIAAILVLGVPAGVVASRALSSLLLFRRARARARDAAAARRLPAGVR